MSSTNPPGNLNVYGQLPSFTQSHAFRPTFKVPSRIYIFCMFCPENLRLKALFFLPCQGKQAAGQFTKHANQKTSSVPYYGNGNTNSGFRDQRDEHRKPERNGESDSLVEMKCGPRTSAKTHPPSDSSSSLKQNSSFVLDLRREMFNLPDFQTDYEDAKFFVIKSYSEDDVHKSIKYSVWSSTVNGNKKLDAAYRDAEAKTLVDGKKRPIFLFFSVSELKDVSCLLSFIWFSSRPAGLVSSVNSGCLVRNSVSSGRLVWNSVSSGRSLVVVNRENVWFSVSSVSKKFSKVFGFAVSSVKKFWCEIK